jgi:hypothetical protein
VRHWFPELRNINLKMVHQLDYATSGTIIKLLIFINDFLRLELMYIVSAWLVRPRRELIRGGGSSILHITLCCN